MSNYAKNVKEITDALRKKAKMVADFSSNPKSVYSHMHPSEQVEHVNAVLENMAKNPDIVFNEEEFLEQMRKRIYADQKYAEKSGRSLNDLIPEDPNLHAVNYDLEKQADDFLRENDPEFFDELEQAMKNYDENIENVDEYSKIPALMEQELDYIPEENPLNYHLSKDPLENASEIEFPDTSLNKRYHNVAMPKGKYYFEGQHKPADYYHNILWNYINKGENRDALLEEFFQDILHKPTPTNAVEKYNTINKYKNALDKRRLELDMKNKPYNKDKLTNMQAIEEYFENQRPYSFEDFESSYLSPSTDPNFEHNYYDLIRGHETSTSALPLDDPKRAKLADEKLKKYKKENEIIKNLLLQRELNQH